MAEYNYLISGVTKTEYEDLISRIGEKESFLENYVQVYEPKLKIDFKYNPDKLLIGIFVNGELIIGVNDNIVIEGGHINLGFVGNLKMNLEKILGEVRLKKDKWI